MEMKKVRLRITKSGKGCIVYVDNEAYVCHIEQLLNVIKGLKKQVIMKPVGNIEPVKFDAKPRNVIRKLIDDGYVYYNQTEGVYEIRVKNGTYLVCEKGLDGLTNGEIGRVKVWKVIL